MVSTKRSYMFKQKLKAAALFDMDDFLEETRI